MILRKKTWILKITEKKNIFFGIILATGILFPGKVDTSKFMLGIVLMIYGVYRFVYSFSKIKQMKMEENRERLNEEREKLLKKH